MEAGEVRAHDVQDFERVLLDYLMHCAIQVLLQISSPPPQDDAENVGDMIIKKKQALAITSVREATPAAKATNATDFERQCSC